MALRIRISFYVFPFAYFCFGGLKYRQEVEQMDGKRPYDDIEGAADLMEVFGGCHRFERRYDFDMFSMADYQSCENCRHLGADDRCLRG